MCPNRLLFTAALAAALVGATLAAGPEPLPPPKAAPPDQSA